MFSIQQSATNGNKSASKEGHLIDPYSDEVQGTSRIPVPLSLDVRSSNLDINNSVESLECAIPRSM